VIRDLVRRLERRRAIRRRRPTAYPDPHVKWIRRATRGEIHYSLDHLLDRAVMELPTGDPVLEIGSLCGLSTNLIAYLLRKHGRPNAFFTTDPWTFEEETGDSVPGSAIPIADYRDLIRRQFETNVRFWNADRLPHSFALPSDEFFVAWREGCEATDVFGRAARLGGPLAFCFVDGAHAAENVRRDFENVHAHLVRGGLVLFDDSDPYGRHPHIYGVVEDALGRGYELLADYPGHLIRKVDG
jgi:hypothetical protein